MQDAVRDQSQQQCKEMSAILKAMNNWANAVLSALLLASGHDLSCSQEQEREQDRGLSTGPTAVICDFRTGRRKLGFFWNLTHRGIPCKQAQAETRQKPPGRGVGRFLQGQQQ
jgi:hypothetical protein